MLSTLHEPIVVSAGKVHLTTKQQEIKLVCVKEYNENVKI
jgi:hypothetical protein